MQQHDLAVHAFVCCCQCMYAIVTVGITVTLVRHLSFQQNRRLWLSSCSTKQGEVHTGLHEALG